MGPTRGQRTRWDGTLTRPVRAQSIPQATAFTRGVLAFVLPLACVAQAEPSRQNPVEGAVEAPTAPEPRRELAELERAATRVEALESELESIEQTQLTLTDRIGELNRRIDAFTKRERIRRTQARTRATTLYKVAQGGYLQLLTTPQRAESLLCQSTLGRLVVRDALELRTDRHTLRSLQRDRKTLQQQRDRRLSRMQSLRAMRQARERERHVLRTRLELVAQRLGPRLARQGRDLEAQADANTEVQWVLRRIASIRQLLARSVGLRAFKGILPWPVTSRGVVPPGARLHRETQLTVLRRGVTVRCSARSSVWAVHAGIVRHRAVLPGYGLVLVLEHPGGYFSVYGFLSATPVQLGQEISRGATLGQAGIDPLDGQPALYFELRKSEHLEDPLRWLQPPR